MIVRDENLVRLAVLNNRHTAAVNGIEANIWCRAQGIRMQTVACVNRVIREFTATVRTVRAILTLADVFLFLLQQGPGLISLCTYPSPGTFIPTSCDCPYNCVSGRVRCGKWCVARGTQCNGGVPVERLCEPGWVLCRGVCVRAGTCAQVLPVPGLPGEPRVLGELDAELEERDADAELEERG
jgi:hypothetical protein